MKSKARILLFDSAREHLRVGFQRHFLLSETGGLERSNSKSTSLTPTPLIRLSPAPPWPLVATIGVRCHILLLLLDLLYYGGSADQRR